MNDEGKSFNKEIGISNNGQAITRFLPITCINYIAYSKFSSWYLRFTMKNEKD